MHLLMDQLWLHTPVMDGMITVFKSYQAENTLQVKWLRFIEILVMIQGQTRFLKRLEKFLRLKKLILIFI
ncbi:hypothetical protein SDC9_88301 [bioreactor metagenome]|uniref:Uncharacterized protein n=1 Tax=bioreactor metagenome TaxID=1076179 RepID=A0A644ZL80_9ZZZZ